MSFSIHPSFYHEEVLLGGPTNGPLNIAAKDFCLCKGCKLPALRVCLGEVEGGIQSFKYASGWTSHFFDCDTCAAKLIGESKPKCACCDDSSGLLKKTTNGYWVHYTCALLTNKTRIISLAEMKFEFKEEFDVNKLEHKKTRSKKVHEGPGIQTILRNQVIQVVSGEKEADDADFTLLRFILGQSESKKLIELDRKQLVENVNSNIEFGAPTQTQKKTNKKKKQTPDMVNATLLLGIDNKEDFISVVEEHWAKESTTYIHNEIHDKFQQQLLLPGDPKRAENYCNCFQVKETENFISCDECQVWYHCGCVGVCLETFASNESFICQKCKLLKTLEEKRPIAYSELEPFKKERLNLDEMIALGVLIEMAIQDSSNPSELYSLDFSSFDLSSIISVRMSEFAVNSCLISTSMDQLKDTDLSQVYQNGAIDSDEYSKLRVLITTAKSVHSTTSNTNRMPMFDRFSELLEKTDLGCQLYEELRARSLRLPLLVSVAKKIESNPELRQLEAHKAFIQALMTAKNKLDLVLADFRQFSKDLEEQMALDDVQAVQACKLPNSRLAEYRKDLAENPLAFRIVEALLADFGLSEAEKNSEIPLKLDHFLVILKKELRGFFKAGESDVSRVWQEKRGLFEKSKIVMHKIQKLKTELPQWKELSEIDDHEAILATRSEVDYILEESEDSVLVMNSAIVKKLSDLKVASIKFEKRNLGDHWNSFESSKRFVFNIIKSGVLFSEETIKLVKELKLYGHIVKFCNNRGMFSITDIEAQLSRVERKFEKEIYTKADMLAEEIKVFLNKASQLQDRKDVWNDRVLEECLQVNKKLIDYRIKLPPNLSKFSNICKSVNWLMDIAEQCGLEQETERTGSLLKYPFEVTLQKLINAESLIDNLSVRTLVRLEKTHAPGVFLHHPSLFVLSSKTSKRVWQKDFEDVMISGYPIHADDFKILLKKWSIMDPELHSLPKEMKALLEDFTQFRMTCQRFVQLEINLLPLELSDMESTCSALSQITGLTKVSNLEASLDRLQRCAVLLLTFSLKIQKALLYTAQQAPESTPVIDSSEVSALSQLMRTVKTNLDREKSPLIIVNQSWIEKYGVLVDKFAKKVVQAQEIGALVDALKSRSEVVLKKIGSLRKEKNISLSAIMEEIKNKPTIEEAEAILKHYRGFGNTVDENRSLIERNIEDSKTLIQTLSKLITNTVIKMSPDEENKQKFQAFEKEFLRLLKKAETSLVYCPDFTIYINAANSLYKVYKLYFEPASQKKWSKVSDSIKETFTQFPEVESIVRKAGVLEQFNQQMDIITQLTERLVKEKITLEDVRAMEYQTEVCKIDKIGNVDIPKLHDDCSSLIKILDQISAATPEKKIGMDLIENFKQQFDNFDLLIEESDVAHFFKAIDNYRVLLRFLQGTQKEGYLMNGFLTDFIDKKYSASIIYNKAIEDLLGARLVALQQYDQIESQIKRTSDDSFREAELKLSSIKPTWDIRNKKLQLMSWLRKAKSIHDNKFSVNLVTLECLVNEGIDFFERSKKLIPKDQRIVSIALVNKIGYLEELLLIADEFLEKLSLSSSVAQLDMLKENFKEHSRIDLSNTIIDMRTQLSFGSIEFTKAKRYSVVPSIRESIGSLTPGEVSWDLEKDFKRIEELFERLIQLDRTTLETRFIEMLEAGHYALHRDSFQLSFEGSMSSREDQMLGKRKPTNKVGFSGSQQSNPKKTELISKVADDIDPTSLISSFSIGNLSNQNVDLETITDKLRENVISNLFICLKENVHFECDDIALKNGAKNLEMHLFSEEHKSKSGYMKAYLFLRSLITRLSNYEAISRSLVKGGFSYEEIMQFRDKSDQRLLAFERELKALQESRYDPLGTLTKESSKPVGLSRQPKLLAAMHKSRLHEVSGDKSLLTDVDNSNLGTPRHRS